MPNNSAENNEAKVRDVIRDVLKDTVSKIEVINNCIPNANSDDGKRLEVEELIIYLTEFIAK